MNLIINLKSEAMRNILIFAGLLIFSCNLIAQNVNNDILNLQKSNETFKTQLNTQKSILLKQKQNLKEQQQMLDEQIYVADSIIGVLQATNSEVQKSTKNQTSLSQSVASLQAYDGKVKEAFNKRKEYTLYGLAIAIIIALVYIIYSQRRISLLKKTIFQKSAEINDRVTNINDYVNNALTEIEKIVEKQRADLMLCFEKHEIEDTNRLQNVSELLNEKVETTNESIVKKLEIEITDVNRDFNKQLVKFVDDFNVRLTEANRNCNDKYANTQKETTKKLESLIKDIEKLKK